MNAFAVTPPSFSALIPHLSTANWDVVGSGLEISLFTSASLIALMKLSASIAKYPLHFFECGACLYGTVYVH
jgi:hypothetical protein